jgi:hypothetical protein
LKFTNAESIAALTNLDLRLGAYTNHGWLNFWMHPLDVIWRGRLNISIPNVLSDFVEDDCYA